MAVILSRRTLQYGVLILVVVMAGITTGILSTGGNGPPDTTWQRIEQKERLIVGVDVGFPPFAFFNPENEQTQGIDVELAQALGAELGVDVEIVWVGLDSRYDNLYLKKVDVLIAAVRPEPLRLGEVRYTSPYYNGGYVFVWRDTQPAIHNLKDFDPQYTLGAEIASPGDIAARRVLPETFPLQRMISTERVLEAVRDGELDYGLVDRVSARLFARSYPAVQVSEQPITEDFYVIAVRRHDWRLRLELENALHHLRESGQLATIIARWL